MALKSRGLYQIYNMDKEPSNICLNCNKKQQLIQQYLTLIDLLKKKNDHSNQSINLKQNTDTVINCNKFLSNINSGTYGLALKLAELQHKKKLQSFRKIQMRSVREQCHKGFRLALSLQRCIGRRLQEGIRSLWVAKNQNLTILKRDHQSKKNTSLFQLDISNNPRNASCYFASMPNHGNEKIYALSRKMFAMNKEIQGLKWSKRILEEQIEENYRRQEIESKKKKESLEMLAEEMAQKNEMIVELQTALSFYQKRQGRTGNNVLDEDGVALRRQNQNLQKINEKLNIELEKRLDQLAKIEQQSRTVSQKLAKLQAQNVTLKEKNFQMSVQLEGLERKKKDYYHMTAFLQKKLSTLKKYQKVISSNLKVIEQYNCSDKSSFNISTRLRNSVPTMLDQGTATQGNQDRQQQLSFAPISQFESQYKIEKILNYVFNIELQDVWISNDDKIFDSQEKEVLNSLKMKFIQLNEQIKVLTSQKQARISEQIRPINEHHLRKLRRQSGDDEVYFNQHQISGSIFQVLQSQKVAKERQIDPIVNEFENQEYQRCLCHRHNGETTTRRDNQNFTIKLLQLQLQKNKQIQKISQLKNKIMHIRCIIMNFLKVIEMKALRQEAKDIVEIFFELFQYSEEEKEIILHQNRREKRFLGLF